jgi:Ca-activated chloride channel family protein
VGFIRLAALSLIAFPLAWTQETPTFRSDVRLVRMLATVRNAQGQLVGGLNKEDFTVTDNGVPQELAIFERQTTQPLSISLLVDTSGSTSKEENYETGSVRKFLKALLAEGNPNDSAALYSFNDEVTLQAPFTRRFERLEAGLKRLHGHGATALYDALYLTTQDLERRDGRHVVVVVSDGGDTYSRTSFSQALEALHRVNAVMYAVVVVPVSADAGRNLRGENALITLTSWTGGKVFFPTAGEALDLVFQDILKDLRTQYMLAYYPRNVPPSRDRFHRVAITVKRPSYSVAARNGYFSDEVLPPSGFKQP